MSTSSFHLEAHGMILCKKVLVEEARGFSIRQHICESGSGPWGRVLA